MLFLLGGSRACLPEAGRDAQSKNLSSKFLATKV
jgi:hypothetical protein